MSSRLWSLAFGLRITFSMYSSGVAPVAATFFWRSTDALLGTPGLRPALVRLPPLAMLDFLMHVLIVFQSQTVSTSMSVSERFRIFLERLTLTDIQMQNGRDRRESAIKPLNLYYWASSSGTANSIFIGSWAKRTRMRPPRDVDVLFQLPYSVYEQYQRREGNKQSQLLQEIRGVLLKSYPYTAIRGDGPAVVVPFSSYNVEVIPAFKLEDGKYWVCITAGGGSYKAADYEAERVAISSSTTRSNGNTRELVKMMKRWQTHCAVPIKSFWFEILAVDFINSWEHAGKSRTWYDWMVRDFLVYLVGKENSYVFAPGTWEAMSLGSAWTSKARTARDRAINACEHEAGSRPISAGEEWQKIFGTDIPLIP
ncbi:hypothetical protein PZ895_07955 [Mesorhizobium sp. YIM 152430]|uniref:SMODS domain-containing nucleotidyltransferase n=1 Tax=Mesorhizobium sp. YIM 152430 TaxID=3031761 RepID=UPI0023DB57B4|nr:hypothetical protein [Mesorhizobium sp. YIM 152430]MDF1599709.1 hypothetical protein [Mesorhizobium sp. YIM 152430]